MSRIRLALVLAVLLVVALPGVAHARIIEYQVQLSPAGGPSGAMAVVNVVLDSADTLPQTVAIPVPHGAALLWAGEILGGSPEDDPARTTTVEQVGDMDVYMMTLEQVHIGQLEIGLSPARIEGDRLSSTMTWTNPGDEVQLSASVIAESGASEIQLTPPRSGDVQMNEAGETLHPLERRRLATGESYVIEASWRRGASSAPVTTGAAGSDLLPYLLGAFIVAVLLLVVVMVREQTKGRRGSVDQ